MEWLENLVNTLVNWAATTGVKLIIALVILLISFKIIKVVCRKVEKAGAKKNADKTVMRTLAYALGLTLRIVVLVCLVGYLGIDTSGITALIASLGVCIGLAVNGALANLAGGVLILLTRPFRVGSVGARASTARGRPGSPPPMQPGTTCGRRRPTG